MHSPTNFIYGCKVTEKISEFTKINSKIYQQFRRFFIIYM